MTATADLSHQPKDTAALMAKAFFALRVFTGLVWLTNGLAKLTGVGKFDWGFFSFTLINRDSAKAIASGAADQTQLGPLGDFYRGVVVAHWDVFGAFLTVAELAIGIGLIFGIATRLAAVGGLGLIGPIWIMLWPAGGYLWEYPAEDLFPLVLLAVVPAGRMRGFDARLAARFNYRWPF